MICGRVCYYFSLASTCAVWWEAISGWFTQCDVCVCASFVFCESGKGSRSVGKTRVWRQLVPHLGSAVNHTRDERLDCGTGAGDWSSGVPSVSNVSVSPPPSPPRPPPSANILVCWFCLINFLRAIKQPATDIIGPRVSPVSPVSGVCCAAVMVSCWMLNVRRCQQWAQSTCHNVTSHLTSLSPLSSEQPSSEYWI